MKRLRVGLVGAGLVGQAEHAFYLWEERERFAFVALADASATVRAAVGARYGLESLHENIEGLLTAKLDALVIAARIPPALAIAGAGLHVMCEKPLALTVGAVTGSPRRATAGRAPGRLYEALRPRFRRALELRRRRRGGAADSVEVNDPDHSSSVAHPPA
jgi:predicted dehydrogenase